MTHRDDAPHALSTHLDAQGHAHMVDVTHKTITHRSATATARVTMQPSTVAALREHKTPKGDVLATARIAGIQAAKRVPELIPLCHSVALTKVTVALEIEDLGVAITAVVQCADRTGVEMEALTAASVTALTLYDMLKGIDRAMRIESVQLEEKLGGRSGHWQRHAAHTHEPEAASESVLTNLSDFAITHEAISLDELRRKVAHDGAGAVCLFVGTVRNQSEGRAVTLLEYEVYETMAAREMHRVAGEIAREIPGVRLAATHRVGALRVGDDAIVCAASAPHRGEAFVAGKRLIDAIKAQVPVWKREHGPDGPYWVHWEDARCTPGEAHEHG
ncbi:MAG: cyclic pyranopterin monophosphate synthase MoaC [Deltaproteobacteria bacterium]|nr:cyclic pyranopterin monophosphate synthase MoaC [Deltaproteobacteria bacterium]